MRVALLFTGVENEFVGGAERFFADFYDIYNKQHDPKNKLFFITNKASLFVFTEKLKKLTNKNNIILIPNFNNRFKNILEPLIFISKLMVNRINVIHIGSYGIQYFHLLKYVSALPKIVRPKIVINIVDCEVPYIYNAPEHPRYKGYQSKYGPLFNSIKIDGIYTWYKLFKDFVLSNSIIASKPHIEAVQTRFSDTSRFGNAVSKRNEIVFAARLTDQKRPLLFTEAVKILKNSYPEKIVGWKFLIYGKGPLENEIAQFIKQHNLEELLFQGSNSDLSQVFPYTKCFVSTQDYENFPSLSMCEAMAAGNAIISRNVGQTDYFVKEGKNGFLIDSDSPEELAKAIHLFISQPEQHQALQNESIRLTKEIHTPENFIKEIDIFWKKVAAL